MAALQAKLSLVYGEGCKPTLPGDDTEPGDGPPEHASGLHQNAVIETENRLEAAWLPLSAGAAGKLAIDATRFLSFDHDDMKTTKG